MGTITRDQTEYYQAHKEKLKSVSRDWRMRNRGTQRRYTYARQAMLNWYKETQGCKDCGLIDHRLLEFDHVPRLDDGTPYRRVRSTLSKVNLWHEIQKCEVVCANCHSLRTYQRRLDKHGDSWYTSK